MLELRPNCECCARDLLPSSLEVRIRSFECTFCATCADGVLGGRRPTCGTPVSWQRLDESGEIDLTLGSRDGPETVAPIDHTWMVDAPAVGPTE